MAPRFMTAEEAARLVKNGDTIIPGYFEQWPAEVATALSQRYLMEGRPRGITLLEEVATGMRQLCPMETHEGMVGRLISTYFWGGPDYNRAILENKLQGYSLGIHSTGLMIRENAAGKAGALTKAGLHSYIDPRQRGGRLNAVSTEDLVELVEVGGEEFLWYKCIPVQAAILRGSAADEDGNISFEDFGMACNPLYIAMAARRWGGKVIVEVPRLVARGSLNPKFVWLPGFLVDVLVLEQQSHEFPSVPAKYARGLSGQQLLPLPGFEEIMYSGLVYGSRPRERGDTAPLETRMGVSLSPIPVPGDLYPMSPDKLIARRAALELRRGCVFNCGSGIPMPYLLLTILEEGIQDYVVPSIEHGVLGGLNCGGMWHLNPAFFMDRSFVVTLYHGGGLNTTFLGLAEFDRHGNTSVSRYVDTIVGTGGAIDIGHNTPRVCFLGTLTAGGLRAEPQDGRLSIVQEGKARRAVQQVRQIDFSGPDMLRRGKDVLYITDRAVFKLTEGGLVLVEVAPGVDVERDVLQRMDFRPQVSPELKTMDPRIFRKEPLGLRRLLEGLPPMGPNAPVP